MKKCTKRSLGVLIGMLALFSISAGLSTVQSAPIRASADTAPSSKILGQSLTIEDNIHVNYAVSTENLLDSDELGVLAWTAPQKNYEYGTQNKVLPCTGSITKDSVEYPVFSFQELAAKKMTDVIYTRPYVLRDGDFHYGSVKKYSILEYAYNKLGKTESTPTSDAKLKKFLNAMLEYGAAAQELFEYELDRLANADYSYVRIENASFSDGFNYGIYKVGEKLEIVLDAGFTLGSGAADYFTVDVNGKITITIPAEKTVDTPSIVEKDKGSQGLEYALNADGVSYTVTGVGSCTDTVLVIPPAHEGLPITAIGGSAFCDCLDLTSVTVGDNVTTIAKNAFAYCEGITELVLGASVKSIENYAFTGCEALTTVYYKGTESGWANITFGRLNDAVSDATRYYYSESEPALNADGTAYDGAYWHYDDNGKIVTWEYEIPHSLGLAYTLNSDGKSYSVTGIGTCTDTELIIPAQYEGLPVTELGYRVFDGCTALTSVVIPDSVTTIDYNAFSSCSNLTNIEIPDSVTTIKANAFSSCSNLKSVVIPDNLTSLGDNAFYACSSLSCTNYNNAYYLGNDNNPYLVLYKSISGYSTYKIHEETKFIHADAFRNSSLTSITIPENVISIGMSAFEESKIRSIVIPDNVTYLAQWAFSECRSLKEVILGNGLTKVPVCGFQYSALESITLGENITEIGTTAFFLCSNLTEIVLPEKLTSIERHAFEYCPLTEIVIPENVTAIEEEAFLYTQLTSAIFQNTDFWKILEHSPNNYGEIISIAPLSSSALSDPATAASYLKSTYYGYEWKISSEGLEYSLNDEGTEYTLIGLGACEDTELVIPKTYGGLPVTGIADCVFNENLTKVLIPESITHIDDYAFYGYENLTTITVKRNNQTYKSIDGNLYTKDGTTLIQYAIGKTATEFIIPDGVTTIGAYAFFGCNNLTSVIISDGVTTIADNAFSSCRNLTNVELPDSVTTIGDVAFSYCDSLTGVVIPESVLSLSLSAFNFCKNLTDINVHENNPLYKSIDGNLYTKDGTTLLKYAAGKTAKQFIVPDNVTALGEAVFLGAYNLMSVTLSNDITEIPIAAFGQCTGLTTVVLPRALTSIERTAFYSCSSLTEIMIPNGVTFISSFAFLHCESLTRVYYEGTAEEWNAIIIYDDSTLKVTPKYYYSESEPALNADGTAYDGAYWHYDENGEIVTWEYAASDLA